MINQYISLKENDNHVYTCLFCNGNEVITKDEKVLSNLIKGKITFLDASRIEGTEVKYGILK